MKESDFSNLLDNDDINYLHWLNWMRRRFEQLSNMRWYWLLSKEGLSGLLVFYKKTKENGGKILWH